MLSSAITAALVLAGAPPSPILSLSRVRLYETGVAYFERSGTLSGTGATLPVPASHLDDALMTLVVLSPGGSVSGLQFPSSIPRGLARRLAGLPAEDNVTSFTQLAQALRGANVAVQTPRERFNARLVDLDEEQVEDALRTDEDTTAVRVTRQPTVLFLGERGELRRIPRADIVSLRPQDPSLVARLGAALDGESGTGARARRNLRIGAAGDKVALGYVAETPLWRATYRVVMGNDGKAMLQGWALVHNDTDENWKGVTVELVNGQPDSFLYPVAAPRYARRELVTPDVELSTVPQLLDQTADGLWGDHADAEASGGSGSISLGTRGYGSGSGSISAGGTGHGWGGRGSLDGASDLLSPANLAAVENAQATEAGALFLYRVAQPVDLEAHGSALVPFVMAELGARPITRIEDTGSTARMALDLVNTSGQAWPGGSVAVFAAGGFAGESALPRLKPGERTSLVFGNDLDVECKQEKEEKDRQVRRVTFDGTSLHQHFMRRVSLKVDLENRASTPRTIHLVLSGMLAAARVTGADGVVSPGDSEAPVAVLEVPARKRVTRTVEVEEGRQQTIPADGLSLAILQRLATEKALPMAESASLKLALQHLQDATTREATVTRTTAELATATADVERARENLRAAGEGRVDARAFAREVMDGESRIRALRRTMEEARAAAAASREHVQDALKGLSR